MQPIRLICRPALERECQAWAKQAWENAGCPTANPDAINPAAWGGKASWLRANYLGIKGEKLYALWVHGQSLSAPNGRANGIDVRRWDGQPFETKLRSAELWIESVADRAAWDASRTVVTRPKFYDHPLVFLRPITGSLDLDLLGWVTYDDIREHCFPCQRWPGQFEIAPEILRDPRQLRKAAA